MRRHLALLSLTVLIGCAEAYPSDFGDPAEGLEEVDSSIPNNTTPDAAIALTPDAAVPQYTYDSGTTTSYDSGTTTSYDAGTQADSGTGMPTDFIGQLLGTFTGFLGGGAKDAGADASP